jgi:hypothetical protein
MKKLFPPSIRLLIILLLCNVIAKSQTASADSTKADNKSMFIDVHNLEPGKVTYADVMAAHQKDLATEGKYDVNFIKFWVDEKEGKVYCLSTAKDSASIAETHGEAHGLLPANVYEVTQGAPSTPVPGEKYFLDVHHLGPGNVTAAAVADAHKKDLATEEKYGVNFINYWVDEKTGTIFCLSQAPDSDAVIQTHKEAHGLLPDHVMQVKEGE